MDGQKSSLVWYIFLRYFHFEKSKTSKIFSYFCSFISKNQKYLSNPQDRVLTRAQLRAKNEVLNVDQEFCMFNVFILKLEQITVKVAMEDHDWVVSMQSELTEFERNKVWRLIPTPKDVSGRGLKWIFKNKTDK